MNSDVDVDIAMVYLPTGGVNNGFLFADRETWLGGRDGDGFGFIDPLLADIPPNGTVVIEDPIGDYWVAEDDTIPHSGAIVVFAYEADTLEDDGTRVLKDVIVNTRVYTRATLYKPDPDNEGEFIEENGTYGQTLPAVPWYNLADPSATVENGSNGDFTFLLLTGATQTRKFRYNIGIVNASDPLTSITLRFQPYQGNGEPFLNEDGTENFRVITLPPAAHSQYNAALAQLFGLTNIDDDTLVKVTFLAWSSGNAEPVVGMTIYGTMIDNTTEDPTAILPLFGSPYDVECQWPSSGGDAKSKPMGVPRVRTRPLEIPSLRH